MQTLQDAATGTLRDWVALILLGIGVQFPPHEFFGGMFMALAGAAISRAWEKEEARRRGCKAMAESRAMLFLVAATAFFAATLLSIVVNAYWPDWSIPVVMAIAGFGSRKLVYGGLRFLDGISKRADGAAQRFIDKFLPKGEDDG